MNDKIFKVGDLVMLKSEGPVITINNIIPDSNREREDNVYCVWFCGEVLKESKFKPSALKIAD